MDSLIKEDYKKKFTNENFDYIRKTGVIRDSIYGVDIQPIAVEVSRLRCFLTLIVDEDIDDNAENRGIKPLPNLEFKFVAANSLISLPGSFFDGGQTGMFEEENEIEKLKKLRDQYFVSNGFEKERIKNKFKDVQREMFKKQITKKGYGEMTMALADWEPFSNFSSSWFDPEWMFGINDGFDIVIANPPYIFSRENLSKEQKELFKKTYTLTQFKLNLYILFIEKSFSLLNSMGVFSFIIPNNWLTLSTTSDLRHFVLTKTFNTAIVFNYEHVFQSASVDTCLLMFKKSGDRSISAYSWSKDGVNLMKRQKPEFFLSKKGYLFSNLDTTSNKVQELLDKINSISEDLGSICDVKNGVQAYTVGEGNPIQTLEIKKSRAYHSRVKHDNGWVKYLDGADVQRYKMGWSGQYIKYGNNLSRPRQQHLFSGERLLVRQIPASPPYCILSSYTTESSIVDNNCIIVRTKKPSYDLKFILGLLNSSLISFWFIYTFGKLQRKTFPQFKVKELRMFSIKIVSELEQKPFIAIVDKILTTTESDDYLKNSDKQAKVKEYEKQIDQMVYKLYGLTDEEIKIVGV